jgi:acetoacetyl-CoA synthetase
MPGARWFPGATLNYARNALRAAQTDPDRPAIIAHDERGRTASLSYAELSHEVARVAAGLRGLGVTRGDRVAAFLPNVPESVIALLATASIGAIWSSCSPDFGTRSVVDRFAQIDPKVLIAVDGYTYNGKHFDRTATVSEIAAGLPGLEAVVMVDLLGTGSKPAVPDGVRVVPWADEWPIDTATAVSMGHPSGVKADKFEEVPFDHPLWVVYSSGTTGLPKPIVHGHGGIVLEHLKALAFHLDLGPADRFTWYTTTGWMMWNFLVGGLLAGTTIVLRDGSAAYPETGGLWELAAEEGLTYLGVGAPYLMACRKAGLKPGEKHDLSALRGIGSTGSPLPPEGFDWVYACVKSDVLLGSLSGGTDVCTGFVGASPLLPVRAGVIPCRCLGARVEAFAEDGTPVTGRVGELVVTAPMPSMPVGFWNDAGGERYRESYFADFPGVWRHGDWIEIRPDGSCVIYGRSDATLNRGGVRMGTSEFYRVVESFPEIADSLVVDTGRLGQEGELVLFVQLTEGAALDDDLARRIGSALRGQLSPRHVPDQIHVVPGVPRTLSGKKLEIPVRKILLGTPVSEAADPSALANPEVLSSYDGWL